MASLNNKAGLRVTRAIIDTINANKQYLSDVDGAIGDGDHGINMSRGFTRAAEQLDENEDNLSTSLKKVGTVLMNEIGGAMGPLYGSFFRAMAKAARDAEQVDEQVFSAMLNGALKKVRMLGEAQVGDKTLLDTLAPAVEAFDTEIGKGGDLHAALQAMKSAAEQGRDSTKDLVARKGRAARLGERSRGVLDAGATSCCLILTTMADSVEGMLEPAGV